MKEGTVIFIKPISQLLDEGWEPIVWGWIKHRSATELGAYSEIHHYHGVEKILGKDRRLTVVRDDGTRQGIGCRETPYHIAREVIGRSERAKE